MGYDQFFALDILWMLINGRNDKLIGRNSDEIKPAPSEKIQIKQPFPRGNPEAHGIAPEIFEKLLSELEQYPQVDLHHMLVVKDGEMIWEYSRKPYRANIWHATYSVCKSITGLAIGMVHDEGKIGLDQSITDFFPTGEILRPSIRMRRITIRHLLTMTSDVDFHEAGVYTGKNWARGFLNSAVQSKPGSKFDYNSLNTYMLSAILTHITGESLSDYLKPRLWEPLGIQDFYWGAGPSGVTKGGWGLWICPEDLAKIGQLVLQKGIWNGKQLISSAWLDQMTTAATPIQEMKNSSYGFQIWVNDELGECAFNGMLGQNVLIYPKLNMVIVTNAGNSELMQRGQLVQSINKFFLSASPPTEKAEPAEPKIELSNLISELAEGLELTQKVIASEFNVRLNARRQNALTKRSIRFLDGMTLELVTPPIGLQPILMQCFEMTFSGGLEQISFARDKEKLFISCFEHEDSNTFEIGLQKPVESILTFGHKQFLVAVSGEFRFDERDRLVLLCEITFLEDAVKRELVFHFGTDEAEIELDESPGSRLILKGVNYLLATSQEKGLMKRISNQISPQLVENILLNTMKPRTVATIHTRKTGEAFSSAESETER